MTDFGSRTDFQALQRSGRAKVVILSVLLLGGLSGATWSFFGRKEGIGNPEVAAKVLVVNATGSIPYGGFLREGGFEAVEGGIDAWERKAKESFDDDPIVDAGGLPAVLKLADLYGYGFVAIERPASVDFSAIETDGTPPDDEAVRFAVLSVGDFAFPHRLTTNPPPSLVLEDPAQDLLAALFAQEPLAELLPGNESPSVAILQRRDALHEAIERYGRRTRAATLIENVDRELADMIDGHERADLPITRLSELHESASGLPLPSGDTLLMTRSFTLTTRDALRPDVALADDEHFWVVDDAGRRQRCRAIMDGTVSVHDSGRFVDAVHGDAMLAQTLTEGLVLYTWRDGEGCAFERRGSIPSAPPGVDALGVPHRSGQVARTGTMMGHGVLSIARAGEVEATYLGMLEGRTLGTPVWWDADLVLVPSRAPNEPDAIDLFKPSRPLDVLRISALALGGETTLHQIAVVPGRAALVVTAGEARRRLYRLDLPDDPHALFDAPPVSGPLPRVVIGNARVVDLDTNVFLATTLTHDGRAHDPSVSPDGRWVAIGLRDATIDRPDQADDDEIAVVPVEGGPVVILTRNGRRDLAPRFTADSQAVLFTTEVEIPRTRWSTTLTRRVALPAGPDAAGPG